MALSVYVKNRIIALRRKGKKIVEIRKELASEEIKVSRNSISHTIKRFDKTGNHFCKPKPGKKSTFRKDYLEFIDAEMEKNDELTSVNLQKLLLETFGVQYSISAIKKVRRKLGWVRTGSKYCQLIREANQIVRLEFAQKCMEENEEFDGVIFTDESSIWMERHGNICFRKLNKPPKLKPTPKHPYKVHVWGGISKRGVTNLVIFTGILRKEFYVETILRDTLLPFVQEVFPDGYRFQQDNDPKHKSKLAMAFLKDNNINYWPTLPESPDMNPIKMLWHELKNHLRSGVKPKNKEELVEGIENVWRGLNSERCTKYMII